MDHDDGRGQRLHVMLPWALLLLFLAAFAVGTRPHIVSGQIPGDPPDALDYAYGAAALLHGSYTVQWLGPPSMGTADSNGVAHIPRYPPGLSILLIPAVKLGGVSAAVWECFVSALLLGLLCAALAFSVAGAWAAPIAAGLAMTSVTVTTDAHIVMSDLPAAMLVVLEVLILVRGRSPRSALVAGLLAGALVWIRIPNLGLVLAGFGALTAFPEWRRRAPAYVLGALVFPVLLGLWQFQTFGSPWTTGYNALVIGSKSGASAFFSRAYIFGRPVGHTGLSWNRDWSNAMLYPLSLLGFKAWLGMPGVTLLGFVGASHDAARTDETGALARFALLSLVITFAMYLPYFWQDIRFMLVPAVLFNTLAAVVLARWLTNLVARRRETLMGNARPAL